MTKNLDEQMNSILKTAFNDFYDYITEKDIIKAAHEYSTKSIYKGAKTALKDLQHLHAYSAEDSTCIYCGLTVKQLYANSEALEDKQGKR